ncbi:MAG TPA: aspartyl protease family protein [Pirellulales bacterium]|nr:aspartyl protease family protein [Pirellulales bacterium]
MGKYASANGVGFHWIATAIWIAASAIFSRASAHAEPTLGDPLAEQRESSRLVAEFDIGTNGRLLLVPVRVANEECQFVVDTGASLTALDQRFSAKLTSVAGSVGLANSAGVVSAQLFECPHLAVGAAAIELPGPIACCDLQPMRRATGLPIQGILGMDFLRSQVVQIDFDEGKLRFLGDGRKLSDYGQAHVLRCDAGGRPYLRCDLPRVACEWFLLDTGATSKTLRAAVFDRLAALNEIALGTQSTAATVSGDVTVATGKLSRMRVGSFSHEGMIFARDARESSLGIDYLRRFLLTLDFPRHTAYLAASKRHESPDDSRFIGFALTTEDGTVQVKSVLAAGPAAEAGVEAGDIILQARRQPLQGKDLFQVREALTCVRQNSLELCLLRAGRVLHVMVIPRDRFAEFHEGADRSRPTAANALRHGESPSAAAAQIH